MKIALITGITGQDGYFLSQLLIDRGYEVHGLVRYSIDNKLGNLLKLDKKVFDKIVIHYGDVTDSGFISNLVNKYKFDEVYHLAAQSFVGYSFDNPKLTYDININGTLNVLEAVKNYSKNTKVYFAGTSELFGKVKTLPQDEYTPFHPRSPYGISKLAGYWSVKHYREAYNIFACSGILFNHESEVRGEEFVTQKIVKHLCNNYHNKLEEPLRLGNIYATRDWGYAKEYVIGMYLMLQQDKPDDYVLSTGETHTIKEFIELCCYTLKLNLKWVGEGLNEMGFINNKPIILISEKYYRPCEVDLLMGDSSKAYYKLGWKSKVKLKELIEIMVKYNIDMLEKNGNK